MLAAAWARELQTGAVLVETVVAACILTVTCPCMLNYRLEGLGPRYQPSGRRHYYALNDLLDWVVEQCDR